MSNYRSHNHNISDITPLVQEYCHENCLQPCGDMDRRLKIPHSAKAECGFRTTPEECLYDSGPIGPSV